MVEFPPIPGKYTIVSWVSTQPTTDQDEVQIVGGEIRLRESDVLKEQPGDSGLTYFNCHFTKINAN
ncbi:unnamed protein product, partial [marine sediment metagenome]